MYSSALVEDGWFQNWKKIILPWQILPVPSALLLLFGFSWDLFMLFARTTQLVEDPSVRPNIYAASSSKPMLHKNDIYCAKPAAFQDVTRAVLRRYITLKNTACIASLPNRKSPRCRKKPAKAYYNPTVSHILGKTLQNSIQQFANLIWASLISWLLRRFFSFLPSRTTSMTSCLEKSCLGRADVTEQRNSFRRTQFHSYSQAPSTRKTKIELNLHCSVSTSQDCSRKRYWFPPLWIKFYSICVGTRFCYGVAISQPFMAPNCTSWYVLVGLCPHYAIFFPTEHKTVQELQMWTAPKTPQRTERRKNERRRRSLHHKMSPLKNAPHSESDRPYQNVEEHIGYEKSPKYDAHICPAVKAKCTSLMAETKHGAQGLFEPGTYLEYQGL